MVLDNCVAEKQIVMTCFMDFVLFCEDGPPLWSVRLKWDGRTAISRMKVV